MTEEQLTRFEFFVRSHFSRLTIKRLLQQEIDPTVLLRDAPGFGAGGGGSGGGAAFQSKFLVTDEMAVVVGGLAKLFVGEVMETGENAGCRRGLCDYVLFILIKRMLINEGGE